MYEIVSGWTKKRNLYKIEIVKNNRVVFTITGLGEHKENLEKIGQLIVIKKKQGKELLPLKSVYCNKWEKWLSRNERLLAEGSEETRTIAEQFDISEQSILVCQLAQELQQTLMNRQYLTMTGQEEGQVTYLRNRADELNARLEVEQDKLSKMMGRKND